MKRININNSQDDDFATGDPQASAYYDMKDDRDRWKARCLAAERVIASAQIMGCAEVNSSFDNSLKRAFMEWQELKKEKI